VQIFLENHFDVVFARDFSLVIWLQRYLPVGNLNLGGCLVFQEFFEFFDFFAGGMSQFRNVDDDA